MKKISFLMIAGLSIMVACGSEQTTDHSSPTSRRTLTSDPFFGQNLGLKNGKLKEGSECALEITERDSKIDVNFSFTDEKGEARKMTLNGSQFDPLGDLPSAMAITGFLVETKYYLEYAADSYKIQSFIVVEGSVGVLRDGTSYHCTLEN